MTTNANQFIGSKISLISKSEIRYEGILYSLDLDDATISLAKVKSFGTEDRPTERPVPPKEEVYEFIIFRGADIKGIDVLEPPKAAPTLTSGLPNDPAIVEVSHYHSAGQSGQGGLPPSSAFTGSSNSGYPGSFGTSSVLGGVGKPPQSGNSELNSSSLDQTSGISVPLEPTESTHETSRSNASTPTLYSNRKSPTIDSGAQVPDDSRGKRSRQYNNNRQGDGRHSRQSSEDRRRHHQNRQVQGGGGGGGGGGQADRQQQQSGYQPRGRGQYANYRGGFRGRGYRPQGIIKAQMPPKVTFNDPYDFDKANEELQNVFSKLKVSKSTDEEKKEGGEPEEANNVEQEEQENKEPAEPFYTKDSFYDKISCESTERSKGKGTRIDWRAERKLNAETFGVPVNNGQRRGGFRGYRGGYNTGGYRGTGGYQQRGGYGYSGYNYGNSGYHYNNRYNGGGRGGQRGGYRQQQQPQPSQPQQATQ